MATSKVSSEGDVQDSIREFFDAERRNGDKILRKMAEGGNVEPYKHQPFPTTMYASGYDGSDAMTKVAGSQKEVDTLTSQGYFPHPVDAAEQEPIDPKKAKKQAQQKPV